MLIYILHNDRLFKYELPKDINGNFVINDCDINDKKRDLITVDGINENWYLSSDTDIQIISVTDNSKISSIVLDYNMFYKLKTSDNEIILLYTHQIDDNTIQLVELNDNNEIIIGNNASCDIFYNNPIIGKKQAVLNYNNGLMTFKNLNIDIPVYINNEAYQEKIIKVQDYIFIMGLKIITIGKYLLINNPNNTVVLNDSKLFSSSIQMPELLEENNKLYKDFYDEKDYYFPAPIFQNKIEPLNLKIATPPNKINPNKTPLILTLIPSLLMCSSSLIMIFSALKNINNPQYGNQSLLTLISCGSMLAVSFIWPFIARRITNSMSRRSERKRLSKFRKYLKKKEEILESTLKEQKASLLNNYISLKECQDFILSKESHLFNRRIENPDFLTIRLGLGRNKMLRNVEYSREEFSMEHDKLLDEIDKILIATEYIDSIPITVSLLEKNIIAFIDDNVAKTKYIDAILLQLFTLHSYEELKIVVLTKDTNEEHYSYIKKLNHNWSNDKKIRYFSTNIAEGQYISTVLERELNNRREKANSASKESFKNMMPYYLILIDDISIYRNLNIVKDLLDSSINYGFSVVMFDSKISNIPNECDDFIAFNRNEGTIFKSVINQNNMKKFIPEFIDSDNQVDINLCADIVSNIPVKLYTDVASNAPTYIGFLEMFNVGKIEGLNILSRWKNNNIINSLSTPIGIDQHGNLLNLDLHEKNHGPHGLIAGMTGSGKSELIISYLLSLAVNYSPNEVQFILIDYKGGGLAGAFENRKTGEKLPHLVGTITNLDVSEMKRTLVSIQSELNRRQILFNNIKESLGISTIDIYKYQKLYFEGKIQEQLAHLFIVCDEFAELKAQQPDFMEQLISAARIGRSLGIHLILATQKPSGVVNDQIWSNSKFKICCRVQTGEDSKEMIRKDDAAYLKDAGSFYFQVGYDEYFNRGQAAYCGNPYVPSDKVKTKVDNSIDFINNIGEVIKSFDDKEEKTVVANLGDELSNVLKYIIKIALENNYKTKQLWLDNIPSEIYIEDVKQKYQSKVEVCNINPEIGEYDNPKAQQQGIVTLPLSRDGNCYIVGVSGSGKSTLMSTIIYSSIVAHDTQELNIYIIDCGSQTLKIFDKAPQVGDFLTINDGEKIKRLFAILKSELKKRKQLFSDYGGSLQNFIKKTKAIMPTILIFINNIDAFKEEFDKIYDEDFTQLTRDCSKNGIIFIVSGNGVNSLSYRILNNFPIKIGLRLLDPTDYYNIFGKNEIIPRSYPGRGIVMLNDTYEFQVARIFNEENFEFNLNYIFEQLNKMASRSAARIPTMPDEVTIDYLKPYISSLNQTPVGLNRDTVEPIFFNFDNNISLITGNNNESIKNFVIALGKIISLENNSTIFINCTNEKINFENTNIKYYDNSFKNIIQYLYKNALKFTKEPDPNKKISLIIYGYDNIKKYLSNEKNSDPEVKTIDEFIDCCLSSNIFKIVLVDTIYSLTPIKQSVWCNKIDLNSGIWIGENFDSQSLFNAKPADTFYENLNANTAIVIKNRERNYANFVKSR